eukprot:m.120603 g.120603  ORF g.120603 m.120603 type:complete len:564 (+) comp37739_c0_seq1:134-1825(+)
MEKVDPSDLIEQLQAAAADFRFDREASSRFIVGVKNCVDQNLHEDVQNVLEDERNDELLQFCGWDVVSILTDNINEINSDKSTSLLKLIAEKCSPREVTLAVAEQLSKSISHLALTSILQVLHAVFARMGAGWDKMLVMVRSSLLDQLKQTFSEETGAIDMMALAPVLESCGNWTGSLVDRACSAEKVEWKVQKELGSFLVGLLGPPVAHCKIAHQVRSFVENVMTWIQEIRFGAIRILEFHSQRGTLSHRKTLDETDETDVDLLAKLACASFSHLLFIEEYGLDVFPLVYHPVYLLAVHLVLIEALLWESSDCTAQKGLALLSYFIKRVNAGSILEGFLSDKQVLHLAQQLVGVMTGHSVKKTRQSATEILINYLTRFQTSQRISLISALLEGTDHSGVSGLLIYVIKEEIVQYMNGSKELSRSDVRKLIDAVMSWKEEADLLKEYDRIMGGLNLLRFLLIRDKKDEDQTGIWQKFADIEVAYIKPLLCVVEKAKKEWMWQLDVSKVPEKNGPEVEVELFQGGPLPPVNQKELAQSALVSIDVIESVIGRIREIADAGEFIH